MEPEGVVVRVDGRELTGVVRPGESWFAAARRTAGSVTGRLTVDDLAGPVKYFAVDADQWVDLRAMSRGDLPALTRWLRATHVRRWWHADGEPTAERVERTYAPRIDGTTRTRMWVVEVNGRSVGFVQDYRIGDHPDFALLAPDSEAVGLDYAIGEPEWVGRQLGARVLWAWAVRARERFPDVTSCFAAPDHRNHASLRVLAKSGFEQGTWFDEPPRDGSTATMIGCTLDVRRVLG